MNEPIWSKQDRKFLYQHMDLYTLDELFRTLKKKTRTAILNEIYNVLRIEEHWPHTDTLRWMRRMIESDGIVSAHSVSMTMKWFENGSRW